MEKEGLKKLSRQNLCSLKCQTSNNTTVIVICSGVTVITRHLIRSLSLTLRNYVTTSKTTDFHGSID